MHGCIHPFILHRLQKSLSVQLLQGVSVAMFCLGDRAYGPLKFCAAGRKLLVRLRQLGATMAVDPGYGDDGTSNGGVFADLDQWLQEKLIPKLILLKDNNNNKNKNNQNNNAATTATTESSMDENLVEETTATNHVLSELLGNPASGAVTAAEPPYCVTVLQRERIALDGKDPCHEWQQEEYVTSYQEFFQAQRPISAYWYSAAARDNNQLRRLQHPPNDDGDDNREDSTSLLQACVTENRRLTAANWEQDTRHMQLSVSIQSSGQRIPPDPPASFSSAPMPWCLASLPYRAGDVAVVMPANEPKEVNAFLNVLPKKLQMMADVEITIQYVSTFSNNGTNNIGKVQWYPGVGYAHWPKKCTLRGWLTHCADIHSLPEREDLRALASYCGNPNKTSSKAPMSQRIKLLSLSETKDSALYVDYILREKRNWVDVFYDFDDLRSEESLLTVQALLGLFSPIRPREFSIASSPTRLWLEDAIGIISSTKWRCFTVELCVAVVDGLTRRGRSYHGLCSTYLASLPENDIQLTKNSTFPMWIRPGSFHGLPLRLSDSVDNALCHMEVPVLCVGAGTGIAPLRSLVQEREAVLRMNRNDGSWSVAETDELNGDNVVVFGCRMKSADFYYEDEWNLLQNAGRVTLLVAFSRDQKHKVYVQQVLQSQSFGQKQIANHILNLRGAVYVAGRPKMVRAVKDLILESISTELNVEEREAQRALSKMQLKGLFSVEAWS